MWNPYFLVLLSFVSVKAESMMPCNLNGTHLVAITSIYIPFMIIEPGYEKNELSYHKESDTYEVKKYSSGYLIDLMNLLSLGCNFTYEVHIRKDKINGNINEHSNGSVSITGCYKLLIEGSYLRNTYYID